MPTTVSGNIKDLSSTAVTSGSFIRFQLRGTTGTQPRVSGTALIAQGIGTGQGYFFDFNPDANGNISGTLYSTRDSTGLLGGDIETGGVTTAVWYEMSLWRNGKKLSSIHCHAKNGATLNISTVTPISTSPIASAPTGDATYLRLDGGNNPLASLAVTGNVTENTGQNQYKAYSFNSVLWVDGIKYTTLAAAYADLPAAGGCVMVPPNYSETLAADITMKHDSGFMFWGPAAITMGSHQFKCAGGTANGFFIDSMIPFGSAGSPSAGVVFTYTGTTTPFSFGDTTTDSFQLSLKNFTVIISGAGASTVGITLNRFHPFTHENLRIIGVTGQIGIKMDGTGGYTGDGVLINVYTNGLTSGIQMFNNGNSNQIIGGTFPNTAAGGKGIDILNGNGNLIFGADIENATVGVNIASNVNNFGNRCWIYGQGNGTDFVIGALATGNIVDNIGANNTGIVISVTDSGTGNSVTNPFKFKTDVNGLATASGGITISAGKNLTIGRIVSTGTIPTSVSVTGAGATGSASLISGSTDSAGIIRVACAGAGPTATGTITINLSAALGGSFVTGELVPSSASTAWNGRATIFQTNYSNTAPIFSWDNNAVALVAGNNYDIIYRCVGQ